MRRLMAVASLLLFAASCSGAAPRDLAFPDASTPLITFVFDDGYDTDYLVARDVFADQGAVACSAITTDWINTPGYLSSDQIRGLRDAGWEIMAHTATHPNLKSLAPAQVEDELVRSKAALEEMGITVKNLVYPYNKSSESVRGIARAYYRSGRGGKNEFNRPGSDPYDLRSFTSRQDLAKLKTSIDRANREHAWMVIYHHEIDAKITLTDRNGKFRKGEQLMFTPSGAIGRHVRDTWFLSAGSLHFVPIAGTPRTGDRVVGSVSNATASIRRVVFNERESIAELLRHIRTHYPAMRIVTIDQGLDILGARERGR